MDAPVFLGLGSNLGDREAALEGALGRLDARGFRVTRRSSLWLTEPVGGPPQGWFLNAVAEGETALGPEALLEACLATSQADPPQGSRLAAFLSDRPVEQIKANIVPKIADQPWAETVFSKWEKSSGLSSPVKKAIKAQRDDGNVGV